MTEVPISTYWLNLVSLDESLATFGADGIGTSLDIPTEEWIRLGRPGSVKFSPEPAQPLR